MTRKAVSCWVFWSLKLSQRIGVRSFGFVNLEFSLIRFILLVLLEDDTLPEDDNKILWLRLFVDFISGIEMEK